MADWISPVIFGAHVLLETFAGLSLLFASKSAAEATLSEADKKSVKSLTEQAHFIYISKRKKYLASAISSLALLGVFPLMSGVNERTAETVLAGRIILAFHSGAALVDFYYSIIEQKQAKIIALVGPHAIMAALFSLYVFEIV